MSIVWYNSKVPLSPVMWPESAKASKTIEGVPAAEALKNPTVP